MKLTIKILSFLLVMISFNMKSQILPQDLESILKYSVKYNFDGINYVADIDVNKNNYYGTNILAVKQARYDMGYNLIVSETKKLFGLKLINKSNIEYINTYINETKPKIINDIQHLDLSIEQNSNYGYRVITNYITGTWTSNGSPVSNPIVDEIKLLQKIYYEYLRLKYKVPNGLSGSPRWLQLKKLILELENANISDIPYLGQKYDIY